MYDVEQLCELTGYKKNTLYNLFNELEIDGVRGKIPGNAGKALYNETDLDIIYLYQDLINKMSKPMAIAKILEDRVNGS